MKNSKYYHSEIFVIDNPWPKVKITLDQKTIIRKYNESNDVIEKLELSQQLPKELFVTCRICNKRIINSNFKIHINRDNYAYHVVPKVYSRTINNKEYILSCCEDCLLEYFKKEPPTSSTYYYMKISKYGMYSFGYSYDEYKQITSMMVGVTEKSMIRKYGQEEGLKRWKEYCNKQAITNSFEYKKEKYGWTEEDFKKFNELRAVTYENLLNKYKDPIKAKEIYDNYINRQKLTKSWDYMVEKFGEEKAHEINKQKALTLENFIRKYGQELGKVKYDEYYNRNNNNAFWSNISQQCFKELDNILNNIFGNNYKTYYATKNFEKPFILKNKTILVDYFIEDLNICIEFNGNCFHANPRIYKDEDTPNPFSNKTAKQIQEDDQNRYKELKELYNVNTYIIWEDEYHDKNFNLQNFIKDIIKTNI